MKTKKLVTAALLAAVVCVATMVIQIPSPFSGYINIGDGFVLLCGWLLSPIIGFCAAALGSALADILSGYLVFAPATFVIKGLMAITAFYTYKLLRRRVGCLASRIIGGVAAEAIMVLGYFTFTGILESFAASALDLTGNITQGVAGIIIGILLIKIAEKSKIHID